MKYVRFYGNNGYCGCDYEEYVMFDDECPIEEIDDYSAQLAYENAESFEYIARGGWDSDWESEDEREFYYEDALSYCGWEYCTEKEFLKNQ